MKSKSTHKSNTLAKAVQTACEIHIRTLDLAAKWTAFDPFGAVVSDLEIAEAHAYWLREQLMVSDPDLDLTAIKPPRVALVKDGKDQYGTFLNHVKGIESAIRRLKALDFKLQGPVLHAIEGLAGDLEELRSQAS